MSSSLTPDRSGAKVHSTGIGVVHSTVSALGSHMAVDISGRVPELALSVDRSVDVPLGHQVQEAVRNAIRSGRLRSGERLPSTRQLASQLGVSRGLVVLVYEQ